MHTESGYENAPATRMLATHCAVCGRPLVDSASVEAGMGPDCRERHGYYAEVSEDARQEGNAIVHAIAAGLEGDDLVGAIVRLRALGFVKLADVITDRSATIEISEENEGRLLVVETPFNPDALHAWRSIRGRRWDGERKVNTVPATERAALWRLLVTYFPRTLGKGPKGPFVVR